jgi:very-short-patch-repair endonuclease
MWVVHSLNPDLDLKPNDLRRRLFDHARNPRASLNAGKKDGRGLGLAESELERRIMELLRAKSFRVEPHVEVGAYRLDLVVEGRAGRVAIECDGDRVHPSMERTNDRFRRQQLERLGWRFIRVRASQFALDPTKTIDSVVRRLGELGVEPIGAASSDAASTSETLVERVVKRAAELRHAIWDRLGEQETMEKAKPSRKSNRPSKKPAAVARTRSPNRADLPS